MSKGQGNPQLEDGYTQIANEILEKLAMVHLAPNAWRVLLFIIRKTYGYHKKVDYIANSQIVHGTGLCKAVVSRCLRTLHGQNIILRNSKKVGIQKNYKLWQKLAVSSSSTCDSSMKLSNIVNSKQLAESSIELAVSSTKVSSCAVTQKKKETEQKKKLNIILEGLKDRRGYESPTPGADAKGITWMLKQEYSVEEIFEAYDYLAKQPFWQDKLVNMQTVKQQIGAILKKHTSASSKTYEEVN